MFSRASNGLFVALRSSLGGQLQARRGIFARHVHLNQLESALADNSGLRHIDNSLEACRTR
jgi:hypothetical protein